MKLIAYGVLFLAAAIGTGAVAHWVVPPATTKKVAAGPLKGDPQPKIEAAADKTGENPVVRGTPKEIPVAVTKVNADDLLPAAPEMRADLTPLEAVNHWSKRMLSQISTANGKEKNSVHFGGVNSMTLALLGAGSSGKAADEFVRFTRFGAPGNTALGSQLRAILKSPGNKDFHVITAASLWTGEGLAFNPEYQQQAELLFDATVAPIPESDRAKTINAWFKKKVQLDEVVNEGDFRNLRLLVATATKIKGDFFSAFKKRTPAPFTTASGKKLNDVPTMKGDKQVGYLETADYKAVSISVKGGASLVLALPKEGNSPVALLEALDVEKLQKQEWEKVIFSIPALNLNGTNDLVPPSKALGLRRMFNSSPSDLSFAGISGEDLYVSFFRQKYQFELDEQGFRGKAADVVGLTTRGGFTLKKPPEPKQFIADRPFLFQVYNEAGLLIVAGIVNDPSLKN